MSGRQTERLARSVFFARYEATQWAHARVAPEHLVLGVLREGKRIWPILQACGLSADALRGALTARMTRGHDLPGPTDDLPLTDAARGALDRADTEAAQHGEPATDVAHLLIGLLLDETSLAATVLAAAGLTLERARVAIDEAQVARPRPSDPDTARITPAKDSSKVSSSRGLEHWTIENHTLRAILSDVHHISIAHIVLPDALDDEARYDASAAAPSGLEPRESLQALEQVLAQAIQTHFNVTTIRDTRLVDVYVLTAPDGIRAKPEAGPGGGGIMAWTTPRVEPSDFAPRTLDELGSLSGSASMPAFCDVLQRIVRRPVLDETGDSGTYRLDVRIDATASPAFPSALREATGLVLTPARRRVELLIVRRPT